MGFQWIDKYDNQDYILASDVNNLAHAISNNETAMENKVDKVDGKGLSANDYTNTDKEIVSNVTSALLGKVDKVTGKGLSTEDFTTAHKNALDKIEYDSDSDSVTVSKALNFGVNNKSNEIYGNTVIYNNFTAYSGDVTAVVNNTAHSLSAKANTNDVYTKAQTYSQTEIDNMVSSVYKFKGSVDYYSELPSTGLTAGDVYNVLYASGTAATAQTEKLLHVISDVDYTYSTMTITRNDNHFNYGRYMSLGETGTISAAVYLKSNLTTPIGSFSIINTGGEGYPIDFQNIASFTIAPNPENTDANSIIQTVNTNGIENYVVQLNDETYPTWQTSDIKANAGDNFAWTGSSWDKLGGDIDLSGYVQKVTGMGLSKNNFTDAYKITLQKIYYDSVYGAVFSNEKLYLSNPNKTHVINGAVSVGHGVSAATLAATGGDVTAVVSNVTHSLASKQNKTTVTTNASDTTYSSDCPSNNEELRFTQPLTSIALIFGSIADDYQASLIFKAGTGCTVTTDSGDNIYFIGSDCAYGAFSPTTGFIYEINFKNTGIDNLISAVVAKIGVVSNAS